MKADLRRAKKQGTDLGAGTQPSPPHTASAGQGSVVDANLKAEVSGESERPLNDAQTEGAEAVAPRAWASSDWARHPASWMEKLSSDLTLEQICMPGAHDAGMYKVRTSKSVFDEWILTQEWPLHGQLAVGVRYFDLRPQVDTPAFWQWGSDKEFYVHHSGHTGPKLDEILDDVASFMSTGQETVILKFSHFDGFNAEWEAKFAERLQSKLQKYLYRLDEAPVAPLTRHALTNLRKKVIVVIDDKDYKHLAVIKDKEGKLLEEWQTGLYKLNGEFFKLYDDYANKMDVGEITSDQSKKFYNFNKTATLFMLNWTQTGGPVVASAKVLNPLLEDFVGRGVNGYGKMLNIINTDVVNYSPSLSKCAKVMEDAHGSLTTSSADR